VDDLGTTGRRVTPFAAGEGVGSRRELLGVLRRIAVNLETAEVLELRADRSPSPALAMVLRERAAQRRRTAGRLRTELDGRWRRRAGVWTAAASIPS
jgi:hypothetical protein